MANRLLQALFYAADVWSVIISRKSLILRVLGYPIMFLHGEEEKINMSSHSVLHHFPGFINCSRGPMLCRVCTALRNLECRNLQRFNFAHEGEELKWHAICWFFFLNII